MGKVVKDGMVQTNIRLSEFADKKLARLAKEAELTLGAFIEKMLDSYSQPSRPSTPSSGVYDDWHSAVTQLNNRLLALESRVEAFESVETVEQRAIEKEADSAALVVSVAVDAVPDDAGAETVVVEPVQRQAIEDDDELDALIKKYGAKEDGGFMGVKAIEKALRKVGYQASQKKVSASLERLKGA